MPFNKAANPQNSNALVYATSMRNLKGFHSKGYQGI